MQVSRQRDRVCVEAESEPRTFLTSSPHTCLGYTSFSCLPIFPLSVTLPIKESSWSLRVRTGVSMVWDCL